MSWNWQIEREIGAGRDLGGEGSLVPSLVTGGRVFVHEPVSKQCVAEWKWSQSGWPKVGVPVLDGGAHQPQSCKPGNDLKTD
jgi:hypothetical protein